MLVLSQSQPEGWRMIDRFCGFRYELFINDKSSLSFSKFTDQVQKHADSMGCFGWIQLSKYGESSFVGEVRCAKQRGHAFQEWLKALTAEKDNVKRVEILEYEDTKIRLHFSHFKILDNERITCFLDSPHQCPEYRKGLSETFHSISSSRNGEL
eukprot:gene5212-7250_t